MGNLMIPLHFQGLKRFKLANIDALTMIDHDSLLATWITSGQIIGSKMPAAIPLRLHFFVVVLLGAKRAIWIFLLKSTFWVVVSCLGLGFSVERRFPTIKWPSCKGCKSLQRQIIDMIWSSGFSCFWCFISCPPLHIQIHHLFFQQCSYFIFDFLYI